MKIIKISITVQFLFEIIQYRTQQIVIFKVLKEKKNAYIESYTLKYLPKQRRNNDSLSLTHKHKDNLCLSRLATQEVLRKIF